MDLEQLKLKIKNFLQKNIKLSVTLNIMLPHEEFEKFMRELKINALGSNEICAKGLCDTEFTYVNFNGKFAYIRVSYILQGEEGVVLLAVNGKKSQKLVK